MKPLRRCDLRNVKVHPEDRNARRSAFIERARAKLKLAQIANRRADEQLRALRKLERDRMSTGEPMVELREQLAALETLERVQEDRPAIVPEKQQELEANEMARQLTLKQMQSEQLYFIPTSQLRSCRIQPECRTNDRRRASLQQNIERAGQIYTPAVVVPSQRHPGMFDVADGHRRWKSAEALGIIVIPARVIDDGTAAESLFILLNGDTARVTGSDWLTGWSLGNRALRKELAASFPRRAAIINRAIGVYGEDRVVELGKGDAQLIDGSVLGAYDPARANHVINLKKRLQLMLKRESLSCSTRQIGEVLLLNGNQSLAVMWMKLPSCSAATARKIESSIRKGVFPPIDVWDEIGKKASR